MGSRHHLTPKFYLTLFTVGGKADSRLFVIDKNTGKTFWATPATTGYECDFYTAEGAGPSNPDDQFVERYFDERIERPAAPVIRSVIETTTIPKRGTMEYARLMGFLASSFVRGHVGWNLTAAVADYTGRAHARELLETPGEWEKMLAEEGIPYEPDGATGIPAMLESINDVTFGMNKNARLKIVMEGIVPLALRLMEYRWHIVGRRENTPDFITSDMPLVVSWSPDILKHRPPVFGEPGNAYKFPLDRNFILQGISSGRLHARQLDRRGVEELNAYTAFHADRFVFCSSDSFAAKFPDEPFEGVEGIVHAHKRRKLLHDMTGGPGFRAPTPDEIESWMRSSPQ